MTPFWRMVSWLNEPFKWNNDSISGNDAGHSPPCNELTSWVRWVLRFKRLHQDTGNDSFINTSFGQDILPTALQFLHFLCKERKQLFDHCCVIHFQVGLGLWGGEDWSENLFVLRRHQRHFYFSFRWLKSMC